MADEHPAQISGQPIAGCQRNRLEAGCDSAARPLAFALIAQVALAPCEQSGGEHPASPCERIDATRTAPTRAARVSPAAAPKPIVALLTVARRGRSHTGDL